MKTIWIAIAFLSAALDVAPARSAAPSIGPDLTSPDSGTGTRPAVAAAFQPSLLERLQLRPFIETGPHQVAHQNMAALRGR